MARYECLTFPQATLKLYVSLCGWISRRARQPQCRKRMVITGSWYDLRDPVSAQAFFFARKTTHRRCPMESHRKYLVGVGVLLILALVLTQPTHHAAAKGEDVQLIAASSLLAGLAPGAVFPF